jgi:mono/diheme cytochrome c family protein
MMLVLAPHRSSGILPLAVLVALFVGGTANGMTPAPDDDEPFLPGVAASYRDASGATAARLDHRLSFHWGGAPPDPRLAGGEFHAVWQGRVQTVAKGDYRFFAFGTGEVELKVAGQTVIARQAMRNDWRESPAVSLPADLVPFELSFRGTVSDARLMVCWSGPDFSLEPIPPHALFHPRESSARGEFERGAALARTLRCGRCHAEERLLSPGPALDRLAGNLSRQWLVDWLTTGEHARMDGDARSPRRMPAMGLTESQASSIADWLLAARGLTPPGESKPAPATPQGGRGRPVISARAGERLFLTLGCLACHTWRDLGASGWPGGGDLTHVGDKRPSDFFSVWLTDPARLNRDHRMPVFSLSDAERTSLALFLAEQKAGGAKPDARPAADAGADGKKLVEQFRCAACHRLPETADFPRVAQLDARSDWRRACTGRSDAAARRPRYQLGEADARAVRQYYTTRRSTPDARDAQTDGRQLLAEHNCLACHVCDGTGESFPLRPPLLAEKLTAVARQFPDLAPLVPAMMPPSLNSVGDKLTDPALADAIARKGDPHRPYLQVRMPRFALSEEELAAIVKELVAADRMPERASPAGINPAARQEPLTLAGGRLVSSDGFGCTSCHQVGSVVPSEAPVNARGPDLAMAGRRIRREWFDRFVRNPARIVPRMEMPSVQIPVTGVLGEKLDDQIAAVWHVLNRPGFEPPLPNPVRVLRHLGTRPDAEPLVVTDVVQHGNNVLVKPFLIGLGNRHNVLLDMESGRLALWTVGDAARQRTKGKSWYWEQAGTPVLDTGVSGSDLRLLADGQELAPSPLGQFVTEVDRWKTAGGSLELDYRLLFNVPLPPGGPTGSHTARVHRKFTALANGFSQELSIAPVPPAVEIPIHVLGAKAAEQASLSSDGWTIHIADTFGSTITLISPAGARFLPDRTAVRLVADGSGKVSATLHYQSSVPVDRFAELPPAAPRQPEAISVAPGFTGERLPLPAEIMPSGFAWRPDGQLVFCTLKGRVFTVNERDMSLDVLADGLPTPYGVNTGPDFVDVSAKYAVLRIRTSPGGQRRIETVASGWGYTADYHDWAVGLPRNDRGEYFLGIPCQQDRRSPAAARFHGNVLRLVPRQPDRDDPRLFAPEPISAGHRFPMGLALDRHGELFVTDNQGNYNPFNELNHVRPGVHFGFINFLDRGKPAPPLTPPAIDIPHPWTRSVNGTCFLDTPPELRARLGRDVFGPLEGHLIGCEYDTRRLIRMTLQRVGDTFQGAAYPLSIPPNDLRSGFLGPIVCAVSPRGELYVGSIRDSGWGAGNNVGEIVRVRVEPDKLPCGIAEVRAVAGGFTIDFFRPVDRDRAASGENHAIQSYRRESTPAYGGRDLDRRTEHAQSLVVSQDARRVTVRFAELRPGFVYEFRLKNLSPAGDFHPAEAHYTLRVVPK